MKIGNREFDLKNETYIMGILNVTPDSFYDGGRYDTPDAALVRAEKMIAQGVDIIDIGGMSTKPDHDEISCGEELDRVIPVVRAVRRSFDIPISIDTYRWQIAEAALDAGADMVNDVWGALHGDGKMAETLSRYNVPCCLMHNSEVMARSVGDVLAGLRNSINHACSCGVGKSNIIIDPGIGFAKSPKTCLRVVADIASLEELERPILLGVSRKSLIGHTLSLPPEERLEGALAIAAYAFLSTHVAFLRVHDVKEHVRVRDMLKAIVNERERVEI